MAKIGKSLKTWGPSTWEKLEKVVESGEKRRKVVKNGGKWLKVANKK